MDYFITGGSGFIGSNLCNRLALEKMEYKIADINCNPSTNAYCIDVTVRLPLLRGDTIVHLASETNVRKSIEFPRLTINKNVAGLLNCIELLQRNNFNRLIFTSSGSSDYSSSPYLASKKSCEAICKAYSDSYGLLILVLKLSSVYGPYSLHKQSVIHSFIKNCLNKKPLTIFGNGSQTRDFIHVDDVVESILRGKNGYISSGRATSIKSIALMISEISTKLTGFTPEIIYKEFINGEVINPVVRSDIFTKVNIDEGLVSTFKWFIENYKPCKQ